VLCQALGGEAVLLDLKSEQYFGLDEVGARVWQLLGENDDLAEIEARLIAEYDAPPDAIARDLRELVEKLIEAGLVIADEAAARPAP
jgi:hypothetical protein